LTDVASGVGSDPGGRINFAGRLKLRGYRWRDPLGHMWSFSTYDLPKEVFSNAHDGRWSWLPPRAAALGVIVLAVAVVRHWNYPAIDFYRSHLVSESKQLREDEVYRAEERESQSQLVRDREATENLLRNIREQWKLLRAAREAAERTATEIEHEEARRQLDAERTGIKVKQRAIPEVRTRTSRVGPANQGQQALLTPERKVSKAAKRGPQEAKRSARRGHPRLSKRRKDE